MRFHFKWISWALFFQSCGFLSLYADPVALDKNEVANYMVVVEQLQGLMMQASEHVQSPEGVRQYRDLAKVLEIYSEAAQIERGERGAEPSLFVKYLWQGNPWVNRNLGIAAEGANGESLFQKLFEVFRKHTDLEIAKSAALQAVLVSASRSIEGAAGLEAIETPPKPPKAVLSNKELEATVILSALAVTTFPAIFTANLQYLDWTAPKAGVLPQFVNFLLKPQSASILSELAASSRIAEAAQLLIQTQSYRIEADEAYACLQKEEGSEGRDRYSLREEARATFTEKALALHQWALKATRTAEHNQPVAEEDEKTYDPFSEPLLNQAEADFILSYVKDSFIALTVLPGMIDSKEGLSKNPYFAAFGASAYSLRNFLQFLTKDKEPNYLFEYYLQSNPLVAKALLNLATNEAVGGSKTRQITDAFSRGQIDQMMTLTESAVYKIAKAEAGSARSHGKLREVSNSPGTTYLLMSLIPLLSTSLQTIPLELVALQKMAPSEAKKFILPRIQTLRTAFRILNDRKGMVRSYLKAIEGSNAPLGSAEVQTARYLTRAKQAQVFDGLTYLETGFSLLVNAATLDMPLRFQFEEGLAQLKWLMRNGELPQDCPGFISEQP